MNNNQFSLGRPLNKKKRILCLTKYGYAAASSRYRFLNYIPGLEKCGWDITVRPLLPNKYVQDLYSGDRWRLGKVAARVMHRAIDLLDVGWYDLCWIQHELLPWAPEFAEWCLRRLEIPYVLDFDDAIFHNYDLHPSAAVRKVFGTKLDRVMAGAAAVVVGNRYLGSRAKSAGAVRVERIPTVVDLEKYPLHRVKEERTTGIKIGWIGSPSTQGYLPLIKDELAQVCAGGKGRLVAIGPHEGFQMEGVPVERIAWSEISEFDDLRRCDIGIMPLPKEDAWAKGKCGFKLIQYMGCALPVVAAGVEANRDIVLDGETGFLASTSEEWVNALVYLREHPEERRAMGLAGRKRMESYYTLQSQLPRLNSLFSELIGPPV